MSSLKLFLRPPCEHNWSANGHIHTKFNRQKPATTETLVYVNSSKMVAATGDAAELKMLAWGNEDAQLQGDSQ